MHPCKFPTHTLSGVKGDEVVDRPDKAPRHVLDRTLTLTTIDSARLKIRNKRRQATDVTHCLLTERTKAMTEWRTGLFQPEDVCRIQGGRWSAL